MMIFEVEIVNNKVFEHANLIFTEPWTFTNEIMQKTIYKHPVYSNVATEQCLVHFWAKCITAPRCSKFETIAFSFSSALMGGSCQRQSKTSTDELRSLTT